MWNQRPEEVWNQRPEDPFSSPILPFEIPILLCQVREEQVRLRGSNLDAPITGEVLSEMKYTRQCVKEILRYRPAAPMVPQVWSKEPREC